MYSGSLSGSGSGSSARCASSSLALAAFLSTNSPSASSPSSVIPPPASSVGALLAEGRPASLLSSWAAPMGMVASATARPTSFSGIAAGAHAGATAVHVDLPTVGYLYGKALVVPARSAVVPAAGAPVTGTVPGREIGTMTMRRRKRVTKGA